MDIERALKDQGERQDAVERAVEVTRLSMSVRAHRLEKPSCIPQRLSSKKTSRGAVRRAGAKPSSKKTTRWTRMIRDNDEAPQLVGYPSYYDPFHGIALCEACNPGPEGPW